MNQRTLISSALIITALIIVSGFAGWGSKSYLNSRSIDAEKTKASDLDKSAESLQVELDEVNANLVDAEEKAAESDKTTKENQDKLKKLKDQENTIHREIKYLNERVSELVEVPTVEGFESSKAIADLSRLNLSYVSEMHDGKCADYRGHFINRGFGWDTVYNQVPDPGTMVAPGATITLQYFDRYSDWERGC